MVLCILYVFVWVGKKESLFALCTFAGKGSEGGRKGGDGEGKKKKEEQKGSVWGKGRFLDIFLLLGTCDLFLFGLSQKALGRASGCVSYPNLARGGRKKGKRKEKREEEKKVIKGTTFDLFFLEEGMWAREDNIWPCVEADLFSLFFSCVCMFLSIKYLVVTIM
jgi:hypothetical protein